MLELTVRLVLSLSLVLGLMLLLARVVSRRTRGRRGDLVRVLHRQPLSRGSSVSVVSVGSRVLVLGTTEHQVQVLTELEPGELGELGQLGELVSVEPPAAVLTPVRGAHRADVPVLAPARSSRSHGGPLGGPLAGSLAGSVLSPATWRQALAAATRRAS